MMKSTSKNGIQVKEILYRNIEETQVHKCAQHLITESISTKTEITTNIETIWVEGSDSQIYSELLKHTPANDAQKRFLNNLKKAIKSEVKPFKVPVCDPSIDENGHIQFISGCKPAVGYSYNQLKVLTNNVIQLGSKGQYILFLATIIYRLIKEGWLITDAFDAICSDSTKLGHYKNSTNAKVTFELTGSRKIVGKCDLGNTFKILAKDEKTSGFWIAGGYYFHKGNHFPLADFCLRNNFNNICNCGVGWFVL